MAAGPTTTAWTSTGGRWWVAALTIEDENGNDLGDTGYDTAPFIGVTLKGRF
jgi:hypothetical protein